MARNVAVTCYLYIDGVNHGSAVPFHMVRDADGQWQPKARPRNASLKERRSRRRAIAALRRAKQRMSRLYVWHELLLKKSSCGNWWTAFNQVMIRRGNMYVGSDDTWRMR